MNLTGGDVIYYILKPPVRFYLKQRFNIHVGENPLENLKEPYLLLGHHVTVEDPIISNAYSNRLIRYIAGDANQDSWLKKVLLAMMESIPFAKNRGDAKSIRSMLRHIKAGHPIGLYPEGGRNWDGTTDNLVPSTAKLIKLLKVPVYAAFLKGGYLSRPRWATYPRRGKLVLEFRQLFDKETVAGKTHDELYTLLVEKLNYNEFAWQDKHRIIFKGRNLAEHIERLLYLCPTCKGVNTMKSQGDKFHCTACRVEYTVSHYGDILGCPEFQDTAAWNKWQRSQLPRIIEEGFSFVNTGLRLEKKDPRQRVRRRQLIDLTVTPDKLVLRGKGGTEVLAFADLFSQSITFQDVVEFYVGKTKYRLIFDPRRHMSVKLFYDLIS